ncbi:hypothetical protein G9A89_004077 [Geosiphon pyriformis]|nr:hypothetical protein G9A89_004077 [Geosiphon pyriformis]
MDEPPPTSKNSNNMVSSQQQQSKYIKEELFSQPKESVIIGHRISGKIWKLPKLATRRSQLPRSLSKTWAQRLKERQERDAVKALENELKTEKEAKKQKTREALSQRRKAAEERERLEKLAALYSAKKMKRLRKKQEMISLKNVQPISSHEFSRIMTTLKTFPTNIKRVGLAVSGGVDSMALSYLLQDWTKHNGIKLHAFTIDHQLREESAEEARSVAETMKNLGIPHEIMRINWLNPPTRPTMSLNKNPSPDSSSAIQTSHDSMINEPPIDSQPKKYYNRHSNALPYPTISQLETRARQSRYTLLSKACAKHGIRHLFLAHHLNDQVTTMVMRLARGSGVEGLAGMDMDVQLPIVKTIDGLGLRILRPLLNVTKERLIETCATSNIPYFEDKTNKSSSHKRNVVREDLKALDDKYLQGDERFKPLSTMALASFVEHMKDHKAYLNKKVNSVIPEIAQLSIGYGACAIDIPPKVPIKLKPVPVLRYIDSFEPAIQPVIKKSPLNWLDHRYIAVRVLSRLIQWTSCADNAPRLESILLIYKHILKQHKIQPEERSAITALNVIIHPPRKSSGPTINQWLLCRQPYTTAFRRNDLDLIEFDDDEKYGGREKVVFWDTRFFVGIRYSSTSTQDGGWKFLVKRLSQEDLASLRSKKDFRMKKSINQFMQDIPGQSRDTIPAIFGKNRVTNNEYLFSVPSLGINLFPDILTSWVRFRNESFLGDKEGEEP